MVSALDYTRLLPSVQYVKNRSCSATITITIDHEGHQRTNPNAPLGTPRSPGGHQRTNPNAPLGFAKLSPEPSLCPGAWDGSLQELLLAVEKDVLTAGDDVNPLPAQPADGVAVE